MITRKFILPAKTRVDKLAAVQATLQQSQKHVRTQKRNNGDFIITGMFHDTKDFEYFKGILYYPAPTSVQK